MVFKRAAGLFALAFGMLLLLYLIPRNVTSSGMMFLNPALFPTVAAWLLVGLGAIQICVPGPAPTLPPRQELIRFAALAVLTVAAALLLTRIGYLPTGIGLMVIVIFMVHERRPVWMVTAVLAIPVGIWFFFDRLLERPLP